MTDATACAPVTVNVAAQPQGPVTISLDGRLNIEACASLLSRLSALMAKYKKRVVVLDLAGVFQADDYGVFFLKELKRIAEEQKTELHLAHMSAAVKRSVEVFDRPAVNRPFTTTLTEKANPAVFIADVGDTTLAGIRQINASVVFLGDAALALLRGLIQPRRIRFADIIDLIRKNGINAIPITGLISFISRLILAFVVSIQLEQLGGHIFIPSLITFAMVAEIGPVMTAVVVAGRSGSAYAAEVGTMKISEEVDALTSMGFDPVLFLTVPRLLALIAALPVLTVFSVIAAILGGLTVCVTMLDLMPGPYFQGVYDALFIDDISWCLGKSLVFAVLIALAGCLRGFQVRGGAAAVGNAATSAVVSGIFLIIFFDSIAAIIRVYWG